MAAIVQLSQAECAGDTDCDIVPLDNFGCAQPVQYVEYPPEDGTRFNVMVAVRWYMTDPPLGFPAINGTSCGTSEADFLDENFTRLYTTVFAVDAQGLCVPRNSSTLPNDMWYVAKLRGLGATRTLKFDRAATRDVTWFSVQVTDARFDRPNAVVTARLWPTYAFPRCAAFPSTFTAGGFTFTRTRILHETCDVVDSAEYEMRSKQPTARLGNLWVFNFTGPRNDSVTGPFDLGNRVTDDFSASVLVQRHLDNAGTGPSANASTVAAIAFSALLLLCLLPLCFATAALGKRLHKPAKKSKVPLKTSDNEQPVPRPVPLGPPGTAVIAGPPLPATYAKLLSRRNAAAATAATPQPSYRAPIRQQFLF